MPLASLLMRERRSSAISARAQRVSRLRLCLYERRPRPGPRNFFSKFGSIAHAAQRSASATHSARESHVPPSTSIRHPRSLAGYCRPDRSGSIEVCLRVCGEGLHSATWRERARAGERDATHLGRSVVAVRHAPVAPVRGRGSRARREERVLREKTKDGHRLFRARWPPLLTAR